MQPIKVHGGFYPISGRSGADDAASTALRQNNAGWILFIDVLLVDNILYFQPIPVSAHSIDDDN